MTDLQKTIEEKVDHWSESSDDEEVQMQTDKKSNNFFSGITGIFSKQKQTESNDKINKQITKEVLGQTKLNTQVSITSTKEKVEKLKYRKKHKLSMDMDEEQENEDEEQENQKNGNNNQKQEKQINWQDLSLGKPLLKAIDDLDYTFPTKIQNLCIPAIVSGKDILASSVTGSGKTGAFLIPLLQRLYRSEPSNYCKVLIILPTRELAFQCYEMFQNLNKYTRLRACLVIGASSMQKQEAELRRHPEFIIATPGRLIDHLQNSQSFDLDNLEVLIFDEADKLLDLGFTAEVTKIAKESNQERQTLLFSATLNSAVSKLISVSLKKPVKLHATPDSATSDKLKQYMLKIATEEQREAALICLVTRFYKNKTLIFFRTKKQCHRMAVVFNLFGLRVCELHGNLSQTQRIQAFEDYKNGEYDFLMATDLASRGLDIKDLKAVINFELPQEATRYIHRVGRTARAGKKGVSVTICAEHEILKLKKMMKKARDSLEKVYLDEKDIRTYMQKIEAMEFDYNRILIQEKQEKQLRKAEMEMTKAQNLLDHKEEIYNRPKKEWFISNRDRNTNKRVAKEFLDKQDFDANTDYSSFSKPQSQQQKPFNKYNANKNNKKQMFGKNPNKKVKKF